MRDYLPDTVFDSLRTWAEVDLCALERNFDKVRARQPENVGVCAVIKADAYGHGSVEVAKALEGKAALFAVAMTDEGVQLRQNGIDTPILVLGHTAPGDLPDLAKYNVATTVSTLEEAKLITEFCRRTGDEVAVHAAVDTGMTRLGFSPDDEGIDACAELFRMKGVRVEGLFTHYASSDSADKTAAYRQEELFLRFAEGLRNRGIVLPVLHACNSAAAIGMDRRFDMVRAGIVLYGLKPSDEVDLSVIGGVEPVMALRTHVTRVRRVPAGTPVSYGGAFVTDRETAVATLSAGYADGVPRLISNRGRVIIRGVSVPILGRVCMDQFMADVTDVPGCAVGDRATIFGCDGEESISADEVAEQAGTIGYEIVCSVTSRVPRVYMRDGRPVRVSNRIVRE